MELLLLKKLSYTSTTVHFNQWHTAPHAEDNGGR